MLFLRDTSLSAVRKDTRGHQDHQCQFPAPLTTQMSVPKAWRLVLRVLPDPQRLEQEELAEASVYHSRSVFPAALVSVRHAPHWVTRGRLDPGAA